MSLCRLESGLVTSPVVVSLYLCVCVIVFVCVFVSLWTYLWCVTLQCSCGATVVHVYLKGF